MHVPAGVENGARLPISGRSQHVRVRILPSKVFTRDGLNVTSTLRLSAADAREGGFFDVETVHGTETTYFDEDAKLAKEASKECLDKYEELLRRCGGDESERDKIRRSMGLKIEQLKAEAKLIDA